MLKYNINVNRCKNTLIPIEISSYDIDDIPDGIDENDEIIPGDKQLVMCQCKNNLTFDENANIIAMCERLMNNDDFTTNTAYNLNKIYKPTSINKDNRSFALTVDKYFDLTINGTDIITDENGKEWWYLYFEGSHFFDSYNESKIYNLYLTFDKIGGYDSTIPHVISVGNSIDKVDNNSVYKGEWINSSIIRIEGNVLYSIGWLFESIFYGVIYRQVDNPSLIVSEEYYNSLDEEEKNEYRKDYQYKDVSKLKFYRDNFIFTEDKFSLYINKPMAVLKIPFSQKFGTDLMQDNAIKENFIDVERENAINPITEMEKDVYHPVIWDSNSDEIKSEVYKIRFNLHFRQHRGDDWLADADSYWNGVEIEGGKPEFADNAYFVYNNKENQSDLLSYLNFTDKDVRYQKNKLKKSFLRIMFFDSTNPTNQNMLAYYTIFMDSGAFFSKYVRYIESEGYKKGEKTNLVGIKVDREPTKTSKLIDITKKTNIDDIEAVRLSSQFVVKDKYMSDASSEGFYLYLWKDNMNGTVPTDIYMKVEFNHAGYGRTIPFMMPFFDKKKDDKVGIKTFEQIIKDWSTEKTKYGIKKYLKYSYIHFKYKYDKETNRHVYYLDDEFYGGNSVYFDDNAITLNLYEAKIV